MDPSMPAVLATIWFRKCVVLGVVGGLGHRTQGA